MTGKSPIHPGQMFWTGDNPGIYLKATAEGPYTSLMLYFRISVSAHGPGHLLLLLEEPNHAMSLPDIHNVSVTDNEPLGRQLVENFCKHVGPFRNCRAFDALIWSHLDSVEEKGGENEFRVDIRSGSNKYVLNWAELGAPFAVNVSPDISPTGRHEMFGCFVESKDSWIAINNRRLNGRPFPRESMGRKISSAFLAYSEIWVEADPT